MFRVAICDNDQYYRKKIADLTLKSLFDTVEVIFSYYDTGMQIMEAVLKNAFMAELLLIDIDLPQIDGLKTARFLRQMGIQSDIVFVTEAIEYSLEGYRYGAFDFIQKPISVTDFEQVMLRYVKEKINRNTNYFQVAIRGGFYKINLRHVVYFESNGRKINAVEWGNETSFYLKMDVLEHQLSDQYFLRIHQSYLVNRNFVSFANAAEVILINGRHLPVSKRYSALVRAAFEWDKEWCLFGK